MELGHYAAVKAALAEEFPLPQILETEGLDGKTWTNASRSWQKKLVEDSLKSGPLMGEFEKHLHEAEDRLERSVEPLDGDVVVWTSFLRVYATEPSPGDFLKKNKLNLNDLSRLGRRWQKRMKEEKEIRDKAAKAQKSPAPLGDIVAAAAKLVASPFAK